MAGPWEKYQQQAAPPAPSGPWDRYRQQTPPAATVSPPAQPSPAPRAPAAPQQVLEGPQGAPAQYQEGPAPTRRQDPLTLREGGRNLTGAAVGAAEAVGTVGTGAVGELLAGLAGLEELARGGDDKLQRAADRIERVREMRTFEPRTEAGKKILEGLGIPFQALGEGAGRAGEAVLGATGSPALATGVHTAIEASPGLVGIRGGGTVVPGLPPVGRRNRADIQRVDRGARDLGVRLNEGVTPQRQQIEGAAERLAAGGAEGPMGQPVVPARGGSAEGVQQGIQQAAEAARNAKNALYEQAKRMDADIELDSAVGLADRLDAVRRDFLTEDMPAANRLLREVEQLRGIQRRRDELIASGGQPKDIAVTINQLEEWGQKIRRNQPNQRTDPAQHAAMERMIRTKDEFMDELFNADMISGNPEAIAAWRRARAANASYRERFSDNKVIRDLVETQADPETVRKWIFGANAAGAKTEASSVVRRIKQELGEDSPEFTALRQDAVLDILDPLLGPEPNLRGFVRRYDQFVGRNRTLANELFGENLQGLTNLRDLAQAHRGRPTVGAAEKIPGFSRILSVAAFGHELAKKSLTVRAGSSAATMLARTATRSPRRRMMADILGYDPFKPMFGPATLGILGTTQELGQGEALERPGVLDNANPATRRTLERLGVRGGP